MLTRRGFIRIIGVGGAAGVLLAGGGRWAATRGSMPDSAIAPWQNTGQTLDDPRLWAASWAMLAPNPHNLQSWRLKLVGTDRLDLFVDLQRLLPHTDPLGRQVLIGQGTFLELYRMAAAERGYRAEIALLPDGPFPAEGLDSRRVASIRLVADDAARPDPLFAHAVQRRSNKEVFDTEHPLHASELAGLLKMPVEDVQLSGTVDPAMTQGLRDLVQEALVLEIETPRTLKESIDLMRIGPEQVAANPDGIDLLGPTIWWGSRLGMVSREDIATPGTESFRIGLEMARDQAQSASGFAWLSTPDNSRLSQLQAGMNYLRLNLQATAQGIALHPMSQLLQEYPEMADAQQRFLTGIGGDTKGAVQMLVRLGHAKNPGPSPRRPLDAIMAA